MNYSINNFSSSRILVFKIFILPFFFLLFAATNISYATSTSMQNEFIKNLEKQFKNNPDDIDLIAQLAYQYLSKENCLKAVPLYKRLIKEAPQDYKNNTALAFCKNKMKDFQGALKNLEYGIEKAPIEIKPSLFGLLGQLYKKHGKNNLAVECFQKGIIYIYSTLFFDLYRDRLEIFKAAYPDLNEEMTAKLNKSLIKEKTQFINDSIKEIEKINK